MLIDDILLEEKFRDGVLVFMNDSRDKRGDNKRKCKEVSGSHTIKKKRSCKCKKKREQVQTTESPSTVDESKNDDMENKETSKNDSSEEMDIGSSSSNE